MTASIVIISLIVFATFVTLGVGIALMVKGGGMENKQLQNKLMTYRIYFQAGAILLIVLLLSASK